MKKILSTLLICLLVCTMLCGCMGKSEDDGPVGQAYVLGTCHQNFPAFNDELLQVFYQPILDLCKNYGSKISYVLSEGDVSQLKTVDIVAPAKDLGADNRLKQAKAKCKEVLTGFALAKATSPEVDTLSAIKIAAASLSSSGLSNHITVVDSGLCTTGVLDMKDIQKLDTDPKIVADLLEKNHALPELSHVADVKWIGLGATAGEQENLPDSYRYKLKALWTEIIERGGCHVEFDDTPLLGDHDDTLPSVSVVNFAKDELDFTSFIPFHEDTIKFVPDKAELMDPKSATDELAQVISYLKNHTDQQVIIAGTTARVGSPEACQALSLKRSQTIKELLVKNGVKADLIRCVGLGSADCEFRVEDHNADGTLNEDIAKKNRAIYMFLSDSDTAKSLDKFL